MFGFVSLLCALLSGLILGLSFPPHSLGGLGWIALLPLFWAMRRCRPLRAALLACIAAAVASLVLFYPFRTPQEWGNAGGGCVMFALLLIWTCGFAAASKTASPLRWSLLVAAAGVIGERLTHFVFPVYLALGQWHNPSIMTVASWMGIWGVSFLIYLSNAALALAVVEWLRNRTALPHKRSTASLRFAGGVVLCLGILHLYGAWSASREVKGNTLRVAALQPGEKEALPLLHEARRQGAQVAVGPELAFVEPLDRDLKQNRVPGLYQVIGYQEETPANGKSENRAGLFTPEGRSLGRYAKIHLFGSETESHQPGKTVAVVQNPLGAAGLAICYDTMYTEIVRELARKGARIAYVPNADPPSSHDALAAMHAAATVFRAAENGIPIVRSEWQAYSMIVDGKGRIHALADGTPPKVLVSAVTLPNAPGTLYTRIGDVLPLLCIALLIALIVLEIREPGESPSTPESAPETALLAR